MNFMEVMAVYNGSNGDETVAMYKRLEALGPAGVIAMNLFRCTKASGRAKVYRGRGSRAWRAQAYDKKNWSIGLLAAALAEHAASLGIAWGWGVDELLAKTDDPHVHVIYVDLPEGQVSFHTDERRPGPDHPTGWDQVRGAGPTRICKHVSALLTTSPAEVLKEAAE